MRTRLLLMAAALLSGFGGEAAAQQASPGEASQVMSCFYECKLNSKGTAWREITTLMLVNQRLSTPLNADILFVNGNERLFARTAVLLSPEDLDELNVCETLRQTPLPFPPPPAGLMEVVVGNVNPQAPHDGAYGWIKNLVGKFPFSPTADPSLGTVDGIAKTQCRLVPPTVTTAREILDRAAPRVRAILIERTSD